MTNERLVGAAVGRLPAFCAHLFARSISRCVLHGRGCHFVEWLGRATYRARDQSDSGTKHAEAAATGEVLEGLACSAGTGEPVRGVCRVCHSLAEATNVQPGEVLVVEHTGPSVRPSVRPSLRPAFAMLCVSCARRRYYCLIAPASCVLPMGDIAFTGC